MRMVYKKNWETFRKSGLLWWVNRTLHLFGWAICFNYDKTNKLTDVFPSRCKFRGFSGDVESKNFIKLTNHMKQNINNLVKDCEL